MTAQGDVINSTETLTGCAIECAYVDKGYRGHTQRKTRTASSSPVRSVASSEMIKRQLRPRSAIGPVIGHIKSDGHLGRCHLKGRGGDPANVVLPPSATISASSLLRLLLRLILNLLSRLLAVATAFRCASQHGVIAADAPRRHEVL